MKILGKVKGLAHEEWKRECIQRKGSSRFQVKENNWTAICEWPRQWELLQENSLPPKVNLPFLCPLSHFNPWYTCPAGVVWSPTPLQETSGHDWSFDRHDKMDQGSWHTQCVEASHSAKYSTVHKDSCQQQRTILSKTSIVTCLRKLALEITCVAWLWEIPEA